MAYWTLVLEATRDMIPSKGWSENTQGKGIQDPEELEGLGMGTAAQ